jgi:phosphoribosylformylglycinamidine synthase
VSEGGLAVCLAESAFLSNRRIGFNVDLQDDIRPDALLFGESQSRICVSVRAKHLDAFRQIADEHVVSLAVIGKTGGDRMVFHHKGKELFNISVLQGYNIWKQSIPDAFKKSESGSS